jgi:hypothetical protein
MKYGFLLLIAAILMLSMNAFAYTVYVADPVITPSAVNPVTSTSYFKFNIDINAQGYTSGPPIADLNADSKCWYSVTDNNTMLPAIWTDSVKRCGVANYHNAQNGDFNFKMIVRNGQGDLNYETGWVHMWSDENAPTSTWGTVTEYYGFTVIPVFASDGMTAQDDGQNALPETLQGSGVEYIWYSDNNGPWTAVTPTSTDPAVPTELRITGVGTHYVRVCVSDRLDTNSCNGGEGEWYKEDLRVSDFGASAGTCDLINLILFVLAAVAIVAFVYGGYGLASGEVGIEHLTALGISAITFLVILVISGIVAGMMCGI